MPVSINNTTLTFNDGTTQTTAFTGAGGTVTSVATGNGLQGGTITSTGTLSVACPTFNTVGSYSIISRRVNLTAGSNYSGNNTFQTDSEGALVSVSLSGTWKFMGCNNDALMCRVS
jgi:hypothetical protein